MDAEHAIALLSQTTGESYRLVGRLHGGETGAHQVVGPAGRRLVVKWDPRPATRPQRYDAVALSERLRVDAHWPVPPERTVATEDCLFVLQDFMPGTPVESLGHQLVDGLLALHPGRLGLARSDDPGQWPDVLITTLTVGGEGYCLHESLRVHNARTASLVARIETFGHAIDQVDLVGHDIVHWDLHPGNLLHDGGTLAAVVDTDFAKVGDAAFDLVSLALASLSVRCDPGVRARLFAAAFDDLDEQRRLAYLAHLFIRYLDWSIRRGRGAEVDAWLTRADEMLVL